MANVYNIGKQELGDGGFDWTADGVTALLADGTYSYNADHTSVTDVGAAELAGTGYSRLTSFTGRTVSVNNTLDQFEYFIDKVVFPSLAADNATPAHLIFFVTAGGNLLCRIPLTTPDAPDGNNYEIRPNGVDGNGLLFFNGDNP